MLFYSGLIHSMGEVHDGNTVTDYMDQERNRGNTKYIFTIMLCLFNN